MNEKYPDVQKITLIFKQTLDCFHYLLKDIQLTRMNLLIFFLQFYGVPVFLVSVIQCGVLYVQMKLSTGLIVAFIYCYNYLDRDN